MEGHNKPSQLQGEKTSPPALHPLFPARSRRLWTQKRRRALEDYLRSTQHVLGLSHWVIDVDWSQHPKGSWAEIIRWPNQQRATLTVGELFLPADPVEQRNTVVHELVHVVLFNLHDMATRVVEELPDAASRLAETLLNDEVERTTDTIAAIVETLVPLPHWD